MIGSYKDEVDIAERDEFLERYGLHDAALSSVELSERYTKFKDVTFGLAPLELWPKLFQQLLEFEPMIAGS